jgi:hypothetical protein
MSTGAIIIIAIAATGVLLMRFRKRWLAKINIIFTNRITSLFAGWLPGFGILTHVGRKSGKVYRTPVNVFYDAESRKLIVNPQEAKAVQDLFRGYLELGCVSKLKARLDEAGTKSKVRTSVSGKSSGVAIVFARRAIQNLECSLGGCFAPRWIASLVSASFIS